MKHSKDNFQVLAQTHIMNIKVMVLPKESYQEERRDETNAREEEGQKEEDIRHTMP